VAVVAADQWATIQAHLITAAATVAAILVVALVRQFRHAI
jgi:hypothetical protein